jgi:hypothetical protein
MHPGFKVVQLSLRIVERQRHIGIFVEMNVLILARDKGCVQTKREELSEEDETL